MNLYTNRHITVDKIINQLLYRKNVIWRNINPKKVSTKLMGKLDSAETFLCRLNFVLGNPKTADLSRLCPNDREAILYHADKTLAHEFNYLGSGWKKIDPINWHTDYIWRHKWDPGKFYREYNTVSSDGGFDIKTLWDFSRGHHLLWLAEAYMLNHEKKYATEIINQIENWISENPLMYSVNWTCSMDVAIRAINWMYAIAMIEDSGCLSGRFICRIERSLYEHGFYIFNNLEKVIPNSGNHYTSDLVGLLFIFSLFPKNFFAKHVFNFALEEYKRELLVQISEDGTSYEHSVSYHRLISELFIIPIPLLSRMGIMLSEKHIERICGAISYIENYSRMGAAPLVGDNDNGRLLPLTPRNYRDHKYMLSLGHKILGYNSEKSTPAITAESEIIGASMNVQVQKCPAIRSIYPNNGCAIIHTGETSLFVTNSGFSFGKDLKVGRLYATHTHPDALSFDLVIGGNEFIVDPGTGVYTSNPELRNELRATANHNTICFDGLDQYGFVDGRMFNGIARISQRDLTFETENDKKVIYGSYILNCEEIRVKHDRTFDLKDDRLIITDNLYCDKLYEISINFHIHPNVKIEKLGNICELSCENYLVTLKSDVGGNSLSGMERLSKYSPSYGIIQDSKNLVFKLTIKGTENIRTTIQWKKKLK